MQCSSESMFQYTS